MGRENVVNRIFNNLTVLSDLEDRKNNRFVHCICKCGNECNVALGKLKSGHTQSCGCYQKQRAKEANIKHNFCCSRTDGTTAEYRSYSMAKNRCNNPKSKDYVNYGGRGVKFEFNSFEDFIAHVGKKPSKEVSLERIETNGNYTVGNIKWATRIEQANNKRNNVWYEYDGERKTLSQWALYFNIDVRTLHSYLKMCNQDFAKAYNYYKK